MQTPEVSLFEDQTITIDVTKYVSKIVDYERHSNRYIQPESNSKISMHKPIALSDGGYLILLKNDDESDSIRGIRYDKNHNIINNDVILANENANFSWHSNGLVRLQNGNLILLAREENDQN